MRPPTAEWDEQPQTTVADGGATARKATSVTKARQQGSDADEQASGGQIEGSEKIFSKPGKVQSLHIYGFDPAKVCIVVFADGTAR